MFVLKIYTWKGAELRIQKTQTHTTIWTAPKPAAQALLRLRRLTLHPPKKEPLLNKMTSTLKSTQDFWQSVTPSYTLQLCSFSWCTAVSKFGFLDSVLRPRPKETKFVFGGTLTDVGRG